MTTTSTIASAANTPAMQDLGDEFPALKHRPAPIPAPPEPRELVGVKKALKRNPDVNLSDEAAAVVTGGLVDPARFRMLVETHQSPTGVVASLLNRKRVTGGVAHVTPQHDRFIDFGIIPDLEGARWSDATTSPLDEFDAPWLPAEIGTALSEEGRAWAMLEIVVADHAELRNRIIEAFEQTVASPNATNDYTDSILASGVKEPLQLMLLRVRFTDGSADEHYLVTSDGNSRLVSLWRARTGGSVLQAAQACVAAVVGEPSGKGWNPVTPRTVRQRLAPATDTLRRGLTEPDPTEATIRLGQTLTAPAVVVVGASTPDGDPMADMEGVLRDMIASVHTESTPWRPAAQAVSGMAAVTRRALSAGLITIEQRRVIEGRCGVGEMHEKLGVPPHRLWAVAVTHAAILNPYWQGMKEIVREEFGLGANPKRASISKAIAPAAVTAYRRSGGLESALRAFAQTGVITDAVWNIHLSLTKGDEAVATLDAILETALTGTGTAQKQARAELSVLGGAAGILDGLITADRGSKESADGTRKPLTTPYRAAPNRMIAQLATTKGGLRTLHALAIRHVTDGVAKQFHTHNHPEGAFSDGDPVLDSKGLHAFIEHEWDVAVAADPIRAAAAIKEKAGTGNETGKIPEEQRMRATLAAAADSALKASQTLGKMAAAQGPTVFGPYESAAAIAKNLDTARKIIEKKGPDEPEEVLVDDLVEESDVDGLVGAEVDPWPGA